MGKWKCGICNNEFDNFYAQCFDNVIYCPLCYFKKINNDKDKEIQRLNNIIDEYKNNTIPTLEPNIDVLVDSEEKYKNIIDELKKYLLERLIEYKNCKNKQNINYLSFKLLILKLLDKIDNCLGDDSNDS